MLFCGAMMRRSRGLRKPEAHGRAPTWIWMGLAIGFAERRIRGGSIPVDCY
jgi:hypothetical protein